MILGSCGVIRNFDHFYHTILGSNIGNEIVKTERELSNKVLEILERGKRKGKCQYIENIAPECASEQD